MPTDGVIVADDAHGVRVLTLSRPERLNAIDLPMIRAVRDALRVAMTDGKVRAVLLQGAGRAFCAGDDVEAQALIGSLGEAALRDQLEALQEISELLTLGGKPTLAAVKGWAVGAGFSWVLNCDLVVWGDRATGFFPEVGFGAFVTGGASWLLPRIVGRGVAREMLLLGRRVTGEAAIGLGLACQLVDEGAVEAEAIQLAARVAELPATSLGEMKRRLGEEEAAAFRSTLKAEVEACVATTLDPQTLSRMRAAISGRGA